MNVPKGWIEATAVVTGCHFQFARLNTLSLGVQRGEKFRITFEFYVQDALFYDEFQSPTAIPADTRIPIAYNPANPRQNTRSPQNSTVGTPLLTFGIAGSLILSLLWWIVWRSLR